MLPTEPDHGQFVGKWAFATPKIWQDYHYRPPWVVSNPQMSAKGEKPHHHRRRHRHRATFLHVGTYGINVPPLRLMLQKKVEMICSWPKTRIRFLCVRSPSTAWKGKSAYFRLISILFYFSDVNRFTFFMTKVQIHVKKRKAYCTSIVHRKVQIEINFIWSSSSNFVGLLIPWKQEFLIFKLQYLWIVKGLSRTHFDNLSKSM